MTSPSSPEGSGLIERLTQAKTWQREDLTALCFEAASALSALEGRLEEARRVIEALLEQWPENSLPSGPLCVRAANAINANPRLAALTALEQSGEGDK